RDGNGIIDRRESQSPRRILIQPTPGAPAIDYGTFRPGADGVPRLNPLFRVWYVDASGRSIPDAVSFRDRRVAGLRFSMQVFGWGRGYRELHGSKLPQG